MKVLIKYLILLFVSTPGFGAEDLYDMVNGDNSYAQGNYKQAIQYYQRALLNNNESVDARVRLARSYVAMGRAKKAERLLNKVISRNPYHSEAHYERARLYMRQNKYNDAIAGYRTSIQSDPNNLEAYEQLADLLFYLGQIDEARSLYSKAESLESSFE